MSINPDILLPFSLALWPFRISKRIVVNVPVPYDISEYLPKGNENLSECQNIHSLVLFVGNEFSTFAVSIRLMARWLKSSKWFLVCHS